MRSVLRGQSRDSNRNIKRSLYQFPFLSSKGGQKRWLLTCSLHCSCSSTSTLIHFALPPSLLIDFKNSKWLTYFCILLCICYRFSHLIGLLSVTWLSPFYKFTRFLIYFLFLSDEGPRLKTLGYILSVLAIHRPFCIILHSHRKSFVYIWVDNLEIPWLKCDLINT